MSLVKKDTEFTGIEIPSHEAIENELTNITLTIEYLLGRMKAAKQPDQNAIEVMETGLNSCAKIRKYMHNQNVAFSRISVEIREALNPKPFQEPSNGITPNLDFEEDLF